MTMIEARIARDLETILDLAEKNGTLGCLKSVAIYFDEMELRAIVKSLREVMPDVAQAAPEPAAWQVLAENGSWLQIPVCLLEDYRQEGKTIRPLYAAPPFSAKENLHELLEESRAALARIDAAQPPAAPVETTCCKGLAPTWECRCEIERKAAGHPPYHRSSAETGEAK